MYCNNCGAKNPDDAKYCSNCGAALGKSGGKKISMAEKILGTPDGEVADGVAVNRDIVDETKRKSGGIVDGFFSLLIGIFCILTARITDLTVPFLIQGFGILIGSFAVRKRHGKAIMGWAGIALCAVSAVIEGLVLLH